MIEEALRRQMQPAVDRKNHAHLAWRMAACWALAGLVGMGLAAVTWLWGWRSPWAVMALFIGTFLATIWVVYRSRRRQPDYRALARNIEEQHPDLQAMLLAAVEQEPEGPDGRWGFMQRRVIGEAIEHATGHDWQESVSTMRLFLANLARFAAMVFLIVGLLQVVPFTSFARGGKGVLAAQDYRISVSPGDTEVEQGSPVVILGRFEGKVPSSVTLYFTPAGQETQQIPLARSLDDPVFGGVVQDIRSDARYHIEYEGRRTREYTVSVYQSPELLRADATIVYPPYTKLPEKTIEDTRQIAVVEGSQVMLRFTMNKPVTTARLSPKSGIALALTMDANDPNVLTTSIAASQSERYELHVADAQGRPNKMPPRFTIDVHKNLPAEIKPLFPNRDVVASPLEEIDLQAEVSDDYGVTGYGLTYALAGTESRDVALGTQAPTEKPQIKYLLAMEDLKAQPDQLLTYYFWADDIGADGSPRRTASDIYFAEVRPFEEIFRESQSFQNEQNQEQQNQQGSQQEQSAEQLAQLQKQIITATWNVKQQAERSGGITGHKDDLDVVSQSQSSALEQAQKTLAEAEDPASMKSLQAAAEHMRKSLDHLARSNESASTGELTPALAAEQSAYQELLKLRDREHEIARSRGNSNRASANSAQFQQQLQQLELTQREDRYETQRMAQPQQAERQEDLQALNRLRDLARRQNEMTDRLREAEAALRQARNEQEREEALRQLKRLRDEQMEALRDVDDLQQRMENAQNRQRMAEAREQLNDSREQIRQSTEALEEGMLSRAITSTARAGRQLEQMREEFQRRTSSQFTDAMRDMREQARELDKEQDQIAEEMQQQTEARQKSLAGDNKSQELAERVEKQRQAVDELVDQMKTTSEQAEVSEPLLSRELYDTLRETGVENLDRALQATGELLKRDFLPQAQEVERRAGEGIESLRKGVEDAASNVLGDEAETLRLAQQQLDELIREVDDEVARAAGERGSQSADANGPASATDRQANARPGVADNPTGDPNGQSRDTPSGDRRQTRQDNPSQNARDGQTRETAGDQNDPTDGGGVQTETGPWDNQGERGPFTGEDFLAWSDRLRDVEDMLPERDLRDEAARVWDRSRAVRAEFKRHGTEPQWDLVRSRIMEPLAELRTRVSERLAQLQSDEALVPIDRDPVPDRFADVVRSYFENLGQQETP